MDEDKAVIHTIEHVEASDLPEQNWVWRRLYIFGGTILILILPFWVTYKSDDIPTLRDIARISLGLVAFFALIYICGAGATEITKLVAAFRSTRKETVTSAPAPATITSSASGETASTTATAATAGVPDRPAWERRP
jgi:hypothetical protein